MKTREAVELTAIKIRPVAGEAAPVALAICALSAIVGIALRFANLSRQSLWFDEGYTAWAVSNPVREIVRIIRVDTAPPLYYLLLRGWTHLFGFSEAALRSMSALMSSIGLLVFILIAKKLLRSPWATALAVMLFSLSFMQVAYAHEARFYAMMTMMGAIDFYLVLLLCERSSAGRLLGTAVAWAGSLWTNNMMAVYLACLGLAWLVLPGRRELVGRFKDAVIVTLLAGLSFAPWVPSMIAQTKQVQSGFWPSKPDHALMYRTIAVLAGAHEESFPAADGNGFRQVTLLLGALALASIFWSKCRRAAIGLLCFGILPIVLIYKYSQIDQSIFMERAFLPSGIIMPLLIVMPFAIWPRLKSVSVLPIVLMLYLSLRAVHGHRLGEHGENWREACAFIQNDPAKHRLVICVSSDAEMLYRYYFCHRDYGPRQDVTGVPQSFYDLHPPRTMQRVKTDADLNKLRELLAIDTYDEIVLLYGHQFWADRTERTLAYLNRALSLIDDHVFGGMIHVYRFKQ